MKKKYHSYSHNKIVVKKTVCVAAQSLINQAVSTTGTNPCSLAEIKINECHTVRGKSEGQFWRDVWTYMKQTEQKPDEIQIVEDD